MDANPTADSSISLSSDDTLLSPGFQPDVLGGPEQKQRRLSIETALFGGVTEPVSVGRFRLLNRLGAGGMGTVYAAYDDQLDRKIAVKLIHTSRLDGVDAPERMLREARALARLSHPNVVHVYEVGEIDHQLFLAMEFLAGPTLRAWLDAGTHNWQDTLAVYRQAGEGLAAAHAQGVVHRDFKPHNAMLGIDKRVRVLDFGLARFGETDQVSRAAIGEHVGRVDEALTVTGALLGTPAYMSPEQFDGRLADARSDQFGFCVALYEALYGERPFAGRTMKQLIQAVSETKIEEPPSGSAVPGWLRKVVVRGLAKAPDERWPSMQALLAALADDPAMRRRRWGAAALLVGLFGAGVWGLTHVIQQDGQPCAEMDAKLEGIWDHQRRAELETAIAATQLSYAPATWERVEGRLDDYTQQWVAARVEACEASQRGEQSDELLDLRIACLDERLQHVGAAVEVLAAADETILKKAVQLVDALPSLDRCADLDALTAEIPPPEDPEVARQIAALDERLIKAKALTVAGKYADSLALVDTVVNEAATLAYEPFQVRAWVQQGDLQRRNSDYERAEATLEQAYEGAVGLQMVKEAAAASSMLMFVVGTNLARHADGRRWGTDAKPWSRAAGTSEARVSYLGEMGSIASVEGKYDEALGYHGEALAIVEKELGPAHMKTAPLLSNMGAAALRLGKYDEARGYLERKLAIMESEFGPEHPEVATTLTLLGVVPLYQGKYDEARSYLERALAIQEKALGGEPASLANTLMNLGTVAAQQERYEEARGHWARALAIQESTLGSEHPDVASLLSNMSNVATMEGKYDEARQYGQRALSIGEKALGAEHPDMAITLQNLSFLAVHEEKYEEARQYEERALAIREKMLGPEHPDLAHSLNNLGDAAARDKEYDKARGYFERALAIWEKAAGAEDPDLTLPMIGLADIALAEGHPAEALPHLERALTILTSGQPGPTELARVRFIFARALWDAPAKKGRDRARALALAELARTAYVEAGQTSADELEEVESWLAERA